MVIRWSERYGLVIPLLVLAVIVALDLVLGPDVVISAAFASAAVVASAMTTVRRTALVAVLASCLAAASGLWNHNVGQLEWVVRLGLAIGLGAMAVGSAAIRVRREEALGHMTAVAEAAEAAILRAMPTAVGSVGFAARYVSATRAAQVGGDFYEVAETPHGVRVIVGDVRGKGVDAVQMAATVLSAFRRAVFTQLSLSEIAADLDAVVAAVALDEDFVTALLGEFHDDHTVSWVNCGHHAPMLVTVDGTREVMDTGEPEVPLGLGSKPHPVSRGWPDGARVLLFTDGLVEARDRHGEFFPLEDNADVLWQGNLDEALDRLLARLRAYAGPTINDDMALVLAEHRIS